MRRIIFIASQLLFASLFLSCSKNDHEEIFIEETNLTACPDGTKCQYLFTERADIKPETNILESGPYRVFWSSLERPGLTAKVYVKAPMSGNRFSLSKQDIIAGKVSLQTSCPACYQISMKAVDGYIKGQNLTPEKRADQSKWILESSIILQDEGGQYRDTVQFKQYFYPNFVID